MEKREIADNSGSETDVDIDSAPNMREKSSRREGFLLPPEQFGPHTHPHAKRATNLCEVVKIPTPVRIRLEPRDKYHSRTACQRDCKGRTFARNPTQQLARQTRYTAQKHQFWELA